MKLELEGFKDVALEKTEELKDTSLNHYENTKTEAIDYSNALKNELDLFRKKYDKPYYEKEKKKERKQLFWAVVLWPINNIFL